MADSYAKRGTGYPKSGGGYLKHSTIPSSTPTSITSSAGDTPTVLDTGVEDDVVTTLTLNQPAPGAEWSETSDPDSLFKIVGSGTSVEVQLNRNLTSDDIGSSAFTAAVAALSLDKSLTVAILDNEAPEVVQSFSLTNLSGDDLSGDPVPFITTIQFGHDEFDKTTQRNAFSISSGSLLCSEMGQRTDGSGDTRLVVVGGIATPTSFVDDGSVTITATTETGSPAAGTAPTWDALLTADTDFDVVISGTLVATPFSQSLRDDGTKLETFYSSPYVACEIIQLPLIDDHRFIKAHVYIFKNDTDALDSGNLFEVQVDLELICSAIEDDTIADKAVTGFSVEMGIASPAEKYDQATSFTWRRYESQKIPVANDGFHRSYSWLDKPTAIMVMPDAATGRLQRYLDTNHVPPYHPDLNVSGWLSAFNSAYSAQGNTPFNGKGLTESYAFGDTAERREFGWVTTGSIAAIVAPTATTLRNAIYDSDMSRGNTSVWYNTSSTPRMLQAFTEGDEYGLNSTSNNRGPWWKNIPTASAAYVYDLAHMNARNYVAYLLSGRYSHFAYMLYSSQSIWAYHFGSGVQKAAIVYYDQARAQGRGLQPVEQMLACVPDDWSGLAVGQADWGKDGLDDWMEYTWGTDDTTSNFFGALLQYRSAITQTDIDAGQYQLLHRDSIPWHHGLSAAAVAMARNLRIGPSTVQAGILDTVDRWTHSLVTSVMSDESFRWWNSCSYYGISQSNPRTDVVNNYTGYQNVPLILFNARAYAAWHFGSGQVYPTWTGVDATIDYTDQSSVIITFTDDVFDMSQASVYEELYGAGYGIGIAVNPTRTSGRITDSDGCGVIVEVVSASQCLVDTTLTPFRYNFFSSLYTYPFKSFSVTSWEDVQMPAAMADIEAMPDVSEPPWITGVMVAAPNYVAQVHGGIEVLLDAASIEPAGTSGLDAFYDAYHTKYTIPWPGDNKYAFQRRS